MNAEGGKSCFRHRFVAKRFQRVASGLTPRQQGFVLKHGFGHLLSIADFNIPIVLLEWIMRNVSPLLCEFRYRGKSICFTKGMVQKVLGIPSGEKPLKTGGMQKDICELRDMYRVGKRAPISKVVEVMIKSDDEYIFMRSFMLVALATVLSPGTGNMVHLDHLFSLADISELMEYDWASDILYVLMKEVERYQKLTPEQCSNPFLIGGCLPLLVIIYMDYLDLPSGPLQDHAINYSCPRICHICDADFAFVQKTDKNRLNLNNTSYGSCPFRELACTPYHNGPSNENAASVDSASLEEWLRMSQSSSQCSQVFVL